MPSSRWLHHLTLGGCLGFLLLTPLSLKGQEQAPVEGAPAIEAGTENKAEAAIKQGQSDPQKEDAAQPATSIDVGTDSPIRTQPQQPATTTKSNGETQNKTNDIARRDLAAQQSMAISTEVLVETAWWQVAIGGFALLLLGMTVYYTKKAAAHAGATLDAANHTISLAQETSRLELRAYLTVEPGGINQLHKTTDAIGHVVVRNVGKLPARNVSAIAHIGRARDRNLLVAVADDNKSIERVIQPGATMRQGSTNFLTSDRFEEAKQFFYVWGVVYYDDGYGERRVTRFCHRYNADARSIGIDWQNKSNRCLLEPSEARYHEDGNDAS